MICSTTWGPKMSARLLVQTLLILRQYYFSDIDYLYLYLSLMINKILKTENWKLIGPSPRTEPVQLVQFWVNIGRPPKTELVQIWVNIGRLQRTEPFQWVQFWANIGRSVGSVLGEYWLFTQNWTRINALVMFALLLIQICSHMNLYTVAHLCSMNICGMISFGGLLSE